MPHAHAQVEWELVQRIISSRRFGRSTLLSDFLLFVTYQTLCGRAEEINEQLIGVHVFARGEKFNPGDDNIVRSYARMLRKRLEDYFRNEGRTEPLVLDIPRGGYVPVFADRSVAAAGSAAEAIRQEAVREETPQELELLPAPALSDLAQSDEGVETIEPFLATAVPAAPIGLPVNHPRTAWKWAVLLLFISLVSGLTGYVIATRVSARETPADEPGDQLSHLLWQQIFDAKKETYIVPTDGGLVILRRFLEHPVTLSDYVSGSYKSEPALAKGLEALLKTEGLVSLPDMTHKVAALGERRYTSVADLDLSTHLVRRREVVPERLMVRYARDLRMEDLHGANAILIGSLDSNPWVELFQPQLNFQFTYGSSFGGSSMIVNRSPLAGEQPSYASITGDPALKTYGVIAYLPNLDGNGHVLIVEGINMAGTDAAGRFLLSAERMRPVLEKALGPNGELRSFEILLATDSIAASSSRVEILSERVARN